MEQAPKKGMSKGCIVALIIVGVIVLGVIAFVSVAYLYKEEAMRMTANTVIADIKIKIANNPGEAVDTVSFNAIADGFLERLKTDTSDAGTLWKFVAVVQSAASDGQIDADEAISLEGEMIEFYPELQNLYDATPTPSDSIGEPVGEPEMSDD